MARRSMSAKCLASNLPVHHLGFVILSERTVNLADRVPQFRFNLWLLSEILANALGRRVQNLPQHRGVPAQSD
jgi:hypothetical protein